MGFHLGFVFMGLSIFVEAENYQCKAPNMQVVQVKAHIVGDMGGIGS